MKLYLGGPGCGKTTRLMELVGQRLKDGVPPDRIAFCAFTRAAADEAQRRAMNEFGLEPEDLPYFRTIHSLAYRAILLRKDEVVQASDLKKFGDIVGYKFSTGIRYQDGPLEAASRNKGDMLMFLVDYSRALEISLKDVWKRVNPGFAWWELKRFFDAYFLFKAEIGKLDFTDMLHQFLEDEERIPVDVAFVDEAQDLTPLQWRLVMQAFDGTPDLSIAGDDDQAIYQWTGADVDHFLNLEGETEVLPISHRLPKKVFDYSQQIVRRMGSRYMKNYRPGGEGDGEVVHLTTALRAPLNEEGSWLLVARHVYQLRGLEEAVKRWGLPYKLKGNSSINGNHLAAIKTWESLREGNKESGEDIKRALKLTIYANPSLDDETLYAEVGVTDTALPIWHQAMTKISATRREYYRACLRRGANLSGEPRINIDTIHGVKGREADNVLVLTDISYRTERGMIADPDSEHRVFFVAFTRAKQRLFVVRPQTMRSYRA